MTPNQSTTTDNQPSACGQCLARAALLAHLAPYIERVADANVGELLSLTDEDLAQAVAGHSAQRITEAVEGMSIDTHRRNVEAAGCWSICRHYGGAWPEGLDELPHLGAIYGKGDCVNLHDLLPSACVSVVGARRASSYGREVARLLGRDLAAAGMVVVSGLAFGVDACAHRGALETGSTVAVMGCGPDVAYPAAHRSLHRRISENGLVLSELPPGTGAWRWSFPARNRIIAAMAGMTVVVEAAERSGSLITAEIAAKLGRAVGAVPGPVSSWCSDGPNDLLADGASLVRGAEDVLNIPLNHELAETAEEVPDPVPAQPRSPGDDRRRTGSR
jgi:DNA processing protein